MPHGFLQSLHQLWDLKIIEISGIISAMSVYGYELSYIDKRGIGVEKENEKYTFQYNK